MLVYPSSSNLTISLQSTCFLAHGRFHQTEILMLKNEYNIIVNNLNSVQSTIRFLRIFWNFFFFCNHARKHFPFDNWFSLLSSHFVREKGADSSNSQFIERQSSSLNFKSSKCLRYILNFEIKFENTVKLRPILFIEKVQLHFTFHRKFYSFSLSQN